MIDYTTINQRTAERIISQFGCTPTGDWLRCGTCPSCGKKELYAYAPRPIIVQCGRVNKCKYKIATKDLYPDLYENLSKTYRSTPKNPRATADAYLSLIRGFNIRKIQGWYTQGTYKHNKAYNQTATVRFHMPDEFAIAFERFVDPVTYVGGEEQKPRNQNFIGAYKGKLWHPPIIIDPQKPLWITESCMDAIALYHAGKQVASTWTVYNYPGKAITNIKQKHPNIKLIWAFDNDHAGRTYAKKWCELTRQSGFDCRVAVPFCEDDNNKTDWNDLLINCKLTDETISRSLELGDLLMAKTATEKGALMYEHDRHGNCFAFEFDSRLWWFSFSETQYNKQLDGAAKANEGGAPPTANQRQQAKENAVSIQEIANFVPDILYMQQQLGHDGAYFLRLRSPHTSVTGTFSGGQLAGNNDFKKRCLSVGAGAIYQGTTKQLDWYLRSKAKYINTVVAIDHIGYSKEHQVYLLHDTAIANGKTYQLNNQDYFDLPGLSIKSTLASPVIRAGEKQHYNNNFWQPMLSAFGSKGIVALAFLVGSLFAEQIRAKQESFPFLEIAGQPGTGKSTIVELLYKLIGRKDYEGFDPAKATAANRARNFAQTGNMPVTLMEGDRSKNGITYSGFDLEEVKPLFAGRGMRGRGVRNSGLDTYEPPFRGALIVMQNAQINASAQVLERFISLYFVKSDISIDTKKAVDVLSALEINNLSYFLLHALKKEQELLTTYTSAYTAYEQTLQNCGILQNFRVIKNHAQLMACVDCLATLIDLPPEAVKNATGYCVDLAFDRETTLKQDHPIVRQFWDVYEFIESEYANSPKNLNHSKNVANGEIALNINEVVRAASEMRQQLPLIQDLREHLPTSRCPKYKEHNKAIWSNYKMGTTKCWIFHKEPK